MVTKIILFPFISVLILFILSFTIIQENDRLNKKYPIVNITGDEPPTNSEGIIINTNSLNNEPKFTYSDSIVSITDVFTGEASLYDLQSNAVPQHIWQNPSIPNNIHLVFMWNQTPGIPAANRRTKYVVSKDRGATWTSLGEVPSGVSSGFPTCYGFNDGRIVIANHSAPSGISRCFLFIEIAPGTGYFITCDPGSSPTLQKLWPRLVTTNNNKIVVGVSLNTGDDTIFYTNTLTNISSCTFSGWVGHTEVTNAEQYAFDRAANGTIGLAFIRNDFIPANQGDVMFISSTNEGLTWSAPTVVFDATPGSEFFGALRGIDLVYQVNIPKVVFDLIKMDDQGNYFPGTCSKIMFWSPDINGGVAFPIADSTNTPCNPAGGINDVFSPISKASIGRSADNNVLFVTYNVARPEIFDSINYYDVYLAWSGNQGNSWFGRKKLTNLSGLIRDCRYANLSPISDNDANFYYANMEYQNDSIPGSHVNGANPSLAKQRFIRVKLLRSIVGIQNTSGEVPGNFALYQNYP
ncbi:MAG: hypothetical protein ACRDFC_07885, partial [Ignavibacteria bacterium]